MADLLPNTPVLVGVGAVQQKIDDHRQTLDPVGLMEQALRKAADDAGSTALLERADEILIPKSLWGHRNPGGILAERLGATGASTLLAEFGILQQGLLDRACQRILDGETQVMLVVGGETRYRDQCAAKAGEEASITQESEDAKPDVMLTPGAELTSEVESSAGLGMPVGYYAIMDSALRYKQGMSLEEHRDSMATRYARFSEIAAANSDAWVDEPVSADFIRGHSPKNRMLAFPYTKLHNSQWTVNQAAGLILCSVAVAQELGIDRQHWVFPVASVESNYMTVISARGDLGASEGFRFVGKKAMELSGQDFNDIRLREIYSCFPFAVRAQREEFGLHDTGDDSVTGAMTFGGGPLNHFVFQATVKMAQLLRENPGETGLVTTVSGLLTKQACGLWSTEPPENGWAFADVTEEVRDATPLRELVAEYEGEGTVAGYTVLYQGMEPWRAIAVFDLPGEQRTVCYSEDAALMDDMMSREHCGLSYRLGGGQFFPL